MTIKHIFRRELRNQHKSKLFFCDTLHSTRADKRWKKVDLAKIARGVVASSKDWLLPLKCVRMKTGNRDKMLALLALALDILGCPTKSPLLCYDLIEKVFKLTFFF